MGRIHWILLILCFFVFSEVIVANAASVPVKVFILAGQSNMVGQASIDHLYLFKVRVNFVARYGTERVIHKGMMFI
jgi:hypothetical protein